MRILLGVPLTIGEITEATSGICRDYDKNTVISHIATDSREVLFGDLFIALDGERASGELYTEEAAKRGAFILSRSSISGITVKNTLTALGELAGFYKRKKLKRLLHTIAITGSVGKTTTKEFARTICSVRYVTHATAGNFNNLIGVPLTILTANYSTEVLITEIGMNHIGEIGQISSFVEPDIAIITNIGTSHIGNLGSRECIAKAKSEVTFGMRSGVVIVPYDEPLLSHLPSRTPVSYENVIQEGYSVITKLESEKESVCSFIRNGEKSIELNLQIAGKHNLYCLGMAAAAMDVIGLTDTEIVRGAEKITPESLSSRLVVFKDFSVFDDSYNSSVESVGAALDTLKLYQGVKRSALLGDMLELGRSTESFHRKIGKLAAAAGLTNLYLFGVYSSFIKAGAIEAGMNPEKIFQNSDITSPSITAEQIHKNHESGEIILFKASHALKLSRICELMKDLEG